MNSYEQFFTSQQSKQQWTLSCDQYYEQGVENQGSHYLSIESTTQTLIKNFSIIALHFLYITTHDSYFYIFFNIKANSSSSVSHRVNFLNLLHYPLL